MPKLIGHSPNTTNRRASDLSPAENKRLVKLSYAQKKLLPQNQVFYEYDTSDRGSRYALAKRWYRWYALPENIACAARATNSMKTKALPLCHVTF